MGIHKVLNNPRIKAHTLVNTLGDVDRTNRKANKLAVAILYFEWQEPLVRPQNSDV